LSDLRGRWHDERCGLPDDVDEGNGLTQFARSRIATWASARSAIDSHSRSWRADATTIRRTTIRRTAIGRTAIRRTAIRRTAIRRTAIRRAIGITVGRRLSDLRDGGGDAGGGDVG